MASFGQIRVLTFNTWGLPWASKDTKLRLQQQADYFRRLGEHDLDIALLQEVWTNEFMELLSSAAAEAGLCYRTIFDGGVFGAGLMVLSRFPITEVMFRPYTVRGEPGALQGEAMSGKGIGYARVRLPSGRPVHLFNTHTHANWVHSVEVDPALPGVDVPTDTFAPYRTANIVEAVAFMRPMVEAAVAAGELVFAGGDWNVPVNSLEATILLELLPSLRDSWQLAGREALDPEGNTCGDPGNGYTGSIIGGYVPERIDYVLTNSRAVTTCETVLKVMPGSSLHYSDHYGVMVTASYTLDKPVPVASAVVVKAIGCSTSGCMTATATPCPAAPASHGVTRQIATGPVGEAKVVPEPILVNADGSGSKPGRRARLLQLALKQLQRGLTAALVRQARLRRRVLLLATVAFIAMAVQLYGIIADTDHWAKRLATGLAAIVALVALAASLWLVPWIFMDLAGQRGLGQLVRMVEMWEMAARDEVRVPKR